MTTLPFPRPHRRHREAPPRPSTKLRLLRDQLRTVKREFADLRRTEQQQRHRAETAEAVAAEKTLAAAEQAAINEWLTSRLYVLGEQAAEAATAGSITVPPMVRNTSAPEDQATAPYGVRTVNGPVEVLPLAEAAKRGHFGSVADTLPLRVDRRPGQTENSGEVA